MRQYKQKTRMKVIEIWNRKK